MYGFQVFRKLPAAIILIQGKSSVGRWRDNFFDRFVTMDEPKVQRKEWWTIYSTYRREFYYTGHYYSELISKLRAAEKYRAKLRKNSNL